MTISRKDSGAQVKRRLAIKLPSHLLNQPFELLKTERKRLVAPKNSDLNDKVIALIFHTAKMFLRPSANLELPPDMARYSENEDVGPRALDASSSKNYIQEEAARAYVCSWVTTFLSLRKCYVI